jgi:hypothetical protein
VSYPVTAISWGPWRAEFVGPVAGGHAVRIRPHKTRGHEGQHDWTTVVVSDATEEGLREAVFTVARRKRAKLIELDKANPRWMARVGAKG